MTSEWKTIPLRFNFSKSEQMRAANYILNRNRRKFSSYADYVTACILRYEERETEIEEMAARIGEYLAAKLPQGATVQTNTASPDAEDDGIDWDFLLK